MEYTPITTGTRNRGRPVAVVPGEKTVALKAKLKTGKTRLKTWLYHSYGNELCGAYYVRVNRLD